MNLQHFSAAISIRMQAHMIYGLQSSLHILSLDFI